MDVPETLTADQIRNQDRSRVIFEAPVKMEEINTEYYLITNCTVWLQEGFKLMLDVKIHLWCFLYFEDGTMTCITLL